MERLIVLLFMFFLVCGFLLGFGWINSELIAFILDSWSGSIAADKWMDVSWPLRFLVGILLCEVVIPASLITFIGTMVVATPFIA